MNTFHVDKSINNNKININEIKIMENGNKVEINYLMCVRDVCVTAGACCDREDEATIVRKKQVVNVINKKT